MSRPFKNLVANHLNADYTTQIFCSMEANSDVAFAKELGRIMAGESHYEDMKLKSRYYIYNTATLKYPWVAMDAAESIAPRRRQLKLNSKEAQTLLEKMRAVTPDIQDLIEEAIEEQIFEVMPPEEYSYTYWLKNK